MPFQVHLFMVTWHLVCSCQCAQSSFYGCFCALQNPLEDATLMPRQPLQSANLQMQSKAAATGPSNRNSSSSPQRIKLQARSSSSH